MIRDNNKFLYLTLFCVLFFGFFLFLGSYPLLDVDETRYVTMARDMFNSKDYMTLYLNGEYFFEKPPLFFWLECFSFKLLGVNEFSSRLPIVLTSLIPLYLLFNLVNKIKGLKFAVVSSITLLTSLEYVLITKIAILDSVLTSLVASSVLCYFYTFFVENKNKKYFWILCFIFSGLAVLAKGIPGAAIPFLIIAISTIVFKNYRETFKYSFFGLIIFLLIVLPWHILMLKTYPNLFYEEYIYKHHILRFLGSDVIHRSEPLYFYFVTLLWGLLPHTFIFLKNIKTAFKFKEDKFLILNSIAVLAIFIFFSISKTKLITYILPIYPFLAILIGNLWMNFIGDNKKRLKLFLVSACALALLIGVATPIGYKINYSFGQNDLMKFSKYARDNNCAISTYKTGKKYSLLYYGEKRQAGFWGKKEIEQFKKDLKDEKTITIIRNKYIDEMPLKVIEKGKKYSMVKGL